MTDDDSRGFDSDSDVNYYNNSLAYAQKRRQRSRSLGRYRSTAAVGSALTSPTEFNARMDEDDEEEDDDVESTGNILRMSRDKKFAVITFCLSNFCLGAFYSILAPFFPTEAMKKGVNSSYIGLVFGSFELVLVLMSPIFGSYLNEIGAKFMYITGLFVSGVCCILFGILDKAPGGVEYLVLCFVVRTFEALGAAAFGTASFAMMAFYFPKHVATMFGTLEMFTGLGLMAGPPLGGILFQFGGFVFPFAVIGSFIVIVGFVSICLLPAQKVSQLPREGSIFSLLKIPLVCLTGLCLVAGAGCIGYFDVTLSLFLTDNFKLSPMLVGFVFLVEPLGYCVMSPIWGRVVDKKPYLGQPIIAIGYLATGFAFFLIGPAPLFNFSPQLWTVILCLAVAGFGISTLTITFQIISDATMSAGYTDNLATYGLIAGLVNSFFSIGAFIGPLGGGFLHDVFGFARANVYVGFFTIFTAMLLTAYTLISKQCRKKSLPEDKQSLLSRESSLSSSGQHGAGKQLDRSNMLITITTA